MDLLVDIHRRTSDVLRGLIAEGRLPSALDLGRFSVRVPGTGARPAGRERCGARGDALVDAALVHAREAAGGGLTPRALARAMADRLRDCPGLGAVEVAGGGLLVIAFHPESVRAAVASVLLAAGRVGRHTPPVPAAATRTSGRGEAGLSLTRIRAEVLAEIQASLARAAGRPVPGPAPPVGRVAPRGRLPGGAGPGEAAGVWSRAGEDAFRFAVASRRSDAVLDLDLSILGDRSRAEPAFWAAYAHARMRGVLRVAAAALPGTDLSPTALAAADLSRLSDPGETALARLVAVNDGVISGAAAAAAPQGIAAHLRRAADAVHSQWSRSKDQPQLRFVNEEQRDLTKARLALVTASALVLHSGLDILGIAAPDEMR